MTQVAESVFLFLTEGKSDKAYNVHLTPEGDGWIVSYENGPRGAALRSGHKTAVPVDHAKARAIFDKLVAEKTRKGYTAHESGALYAGTDKAGALTGYRPQLLNPIDAEHAGDLFRVWTAIAAQTKHDGERRGILAGMDTIIGANRSGLTTGMRTDIIDALRTALPAGDTILDTEDMGDHLRVFDVLAWDGDDITGLPFRIRAMRLHDLADRVAGTPLAAVIRVDVPAWPQDAASLAAFIAAARGRNEEGIVLRNGDAAYSADRPASGGDVLKVKFVETATVRVAAISDTKRSVSMELHDDGRWTQVGSVTIPAGVTIPPAGALLEVAYLYARKGGALFQPVYKGLRNDVGIEAARLSQLKFRKKDTDPMP